MEKEERLDRAKRSLERALSSQHARDVSNEVTSLLLNLAATDAKFADIGTNEHEVRAALCRGYLAEIKTLTICAAAAVPQEGAALIDAVTKLMRRADDALAELNGRVDKELALFMEANDPFLKGMREAEVANREAGVELLTGLDLDALDLQFSRLSEAPVPASSADMSGQAVQIREHSEHYLDFVITVEEGGSIDFDLET